MARTATLREGRLSFLDFARGIAAFAVLLQHSSETYWPSMQYATHEFFNPGRFGVVVFFLVSGYIIPVSLERGRSARRFWVGRVFRLYPAYWCSLVAILVVAAFRPWALASDFQQHTVLYSAVNVTMLQEYVGVPHAIGLYYTLTLEMLFYATCSVLFVVGLLRRAVRNAWVVVGGGALVALLGPSVLGKRVPMAGIFYLASMFVGTVFYRYAHGEVPRRVLLALVGAVAVLGFAGSYVNYVRYHEATDPFTFLGATTAWTLAYLFFVTAFVARRESFPRLFQWLGRISYSLYLVHPVVLAVVAGWTDRALGLLVVVVVSLAVATVMFHVVEAPFQRMGRRLQRRIDARPATVAAPA